MPNTTFHDWRPRLESVLPNYGHRNWIAVVDSAYPQQSAPGVETISTAEDIGNVLKHVVSAIADCRHIQPTVYVDKELSFLSEADAPGIQAYRAKLDNIFIQGSLIELPHEEITYKLDEASRTFNVLILKTTFVLPYTSVFFQLECGYWDVIREERLRSRIASS